MKRIMVAYDDTEPAQRALERAAELAGAFASEVILTSVAPLMVASPRSAGPVDPSDPPERHAEQLRRAEGILREKGITAVSIPAVGDPATAIANLAEERDVDLVVVGTREPGIVERLMRQSVSANVARRVHRDLLIVHPSHD